MLNTILTEITKNKQGVEIGGPSFIVNVIYEKNVGEDDLSTLPEILANHDLSMDLPAGDLDHFTKRSLDNFNNRYVHHYVYNDELLMEICKYFKCTFTYMETQGLYRRFIIKKSAY